MSYANKVYDSRSTSNYVITATIAWVRLGQQLLTLFQVTYQEYYLLLFLKSLVYSQIKVSHDFNHSSTSI